MGRRWSSARRSGPKRASQGVKDEDGDMVRRLVIAVMIMLNILVIIEMETAMIMMVVGTEA